MQRFITLTIGLTLAASSLVAQSGPLQAPVPGPYLVMRPQQPAMPAFTPQRFAMPLPYWMQNQQPRQPQQQPRAQTQAPSQTQPAVGRAAQNPASPAWNAPVSNRNAPTPGFFPGYNTGQPQNAQRQQQRQPTAPYGAPYPANNYAPMPWGQGGQQGFRPMPAPWQYGQNGWGNNWNNTGYGNQQGYAAPNRTRQ